MLLKQILFSGYFSFVCSMYCSDFNILFYLIIDLPFFVRRWPLYLNMQLWMNTPFLFQHSHLYFNAYFSWISSANLIMTNVEYLFWFFDNFFYCSKLRYKSFSWPLRKIVNIQRSTSKFGIIKLAKDIKDNLNMPKQLLSLFEPEAVNTAATLYRSFTHLPICTQFQFSCYRNKTPKFSYWCSNFIAK